MEQKPGKLIVGVEDAKCAVVCVPSTFMRINVTLRPAYGT